MLAPPCLHHRLVVVSRRAALTLVGRHHEERGESPSLAVPPAVPHELVKSSCRRKQRARNEDTGTVARRRRHHSINESTAKHCCNLRRRETPRGTVCGTLRGPETVPSRFRHSPGFHRAHALRFGNGRADSVRAPQSGPFLRSKVAEQTGFALLL